MTLEEFLKRYPINKFKRKWIKNKHFMKNIARYFQKWWNSKKFYWHKYSYDLCYFFPNKFDIWWDPNKFNWLASWTLIQYLPEKFDIWWNPKKFNWKLYSCELCKYLPDKFDQWWDPNKFQYQDSSSPYHDPFYDDLVLFEETFDPWGNPIEDFHGEALPLLIEYISTKFSKWWIRSNIDNIEFKKIFLKLF